MRMLLFLTFIVLLKSEASGVWTRVHNLIWLGQPERDQAEQEQEFEQRWTEVINNMNSMLEFHEVQTRFVKGQMIAMDTSFWELGKTDCSDALGTYCSEIADSHGRTEDMNESTGNIWSCVVPDWFKKGCGGRAKGQTINIVGYAFFNTEKIGIYHEIAHNMGCGHQSNYCPQEKFEAFAYATGKLPQTVMGGMGAGCDKDDFEDFDDWRFLYFTDKDKEYCENGACVPLGNEDYDCAGKMRNQIEEFKSKYENKCDKLGVNSGLFDYCIHGDNLSCDLTNDFQVDFGGKKNEDCAKAMNDDPSLCPSMTFYTNKRKGCACCDTSTISNGKQKIFVATPQETSSLIQLSSDAAENARLKQANEALRQALFELAQN
jgi:hypothetical protein